MLYTSIIYYLSYVEDRDGIVLPGWFNNWSFVWVSTLASHGVSFIIEIFLLLTKKEVGIYAKFA